MTISFDYDAYLEHKPFLDELAVLFQKAGHRVGIITGVREKEADLQRMREIDKRKEITEALGFKADFMHLWGESEAIANGSLWKCEKMDAEDVLVHFDDDATDMKKFTDRWIMKTLNNGNLAKF